MERSHHKDFTIDSYDKITSTNDLAFELASNNQINHNHVIVAKQQDAGHGRYGRDWVSPIGNLYFSLVIRPQNSLKDASLLSFIAAISLSKTIPNIPLKAGLDIKHKWPNDILINDKKAAGILLKSDHLNNFIVIGVGMNVTSHPKDVIFEATDLKSEKIEQLDINKLLKSFLDNFDIFYQEYLNFGFEPIRNLWLKRVYSLGKEITININNQKSTGIFKDLDSSGNLILEGHNKEIKIIASGEIFT